MRPEAHGAREPGSEALPRAARSGGGPDGGTTHVALGPDTLRRGDCSRVGWRRRSRVTAGGLRRNRRHADRPGRRRPGHGSDGRDGPDGRTAEGGSGHHHHHPHRHARAPDHVRPGGAAHQDHRHPADHRRRVRQDAPAHRDRRVVRRPAEDRIELRPHGTGGTRAGRPSQRCVSGSHRHARRGRCHAGLPGQNRHHEPERRRRQARVVDHHGRGDIARHLTARPGALRRAGRLRGSQERARTRAGPGHRQHARRRALRLDRRRHQHGHPQGGRRHAHRRARAGEHVRAQFLEDARAASGARGQVHEGVVRSGAARGHGAWHGRCHTARMRLRARHRGDRGEDIETRQVERRLAYDRRRPRRWHHSRRPWA